MPNVPLKACSVNFFKPFLCRQLRMHERLPTGSTDKVLDASRRSFIVARNRLTTRIEFRFRCRRRSARRIGETSAITFEAIFPREMSARLVDDVFTAERRIGELLVDTTGKHARRRKLFISGTAAADEQNASLLAFKRELAGSGDRSLTALAAEVAVCRDREHGRPCRFAEQEEKTVDLQSLIIKVERGILSLEVQERAARQDIERAERHKKVVADELAQVAIEIEDAKSVSPEANENSASAKRSSAESRAAELEEINAPARGSPHRSPTPKTPSSAKSVRIAATSGERLRAVHSAKRRVENEQKELESRIALLNLELSEIDTKITVTSRIECRDRRQDRTVPKRRSLTSMTELQDAIEFVTNERERADAVSAELADVNRASVDAANERAAIEVRQAETVTLLKNVTENCTHELGHGHRRTGGDRTCRSEDFDLEYSRTYAEDLRTRLEGFGAINMLAVDELAEAEERLLFLTSQRQDIIDSIASAEEALREIKERSRAAVQARIRSDQRKFLRVFPGAFRRRTRRNVAARIRRHSRSRHRGCRAAAGQTPAEYPSAFGR